VLHVHATLCDPLTSNMPDSILAER
jgi:hypothetical protein